MGYTKQALTGISWVGAIRVITRFLTVFKTAIIARILTPTQFGVFGIATLVLAFIEIITETGINIFLVQQKEDADKYINTAWIISIIRGFIISFVILITIPFIIYFFNSPESLNSLLLVCFVPIIRGFINPSIIKFQKELLFQKEFIYKTSLFLVETIASVILVIILKSPTALIWALIISAILEVIISFILIRPLPRLEFKLPLFMQVFHQGKWITLSGIFNYFFQHGDDIAVGKILGTTSLGFYDMAYRVSLVPLSDFSETFARVTFPVYVKISDDTKRLKKAFFKSLGFLVILILPICAFIFYYPEIIIQIILGDQWIQIAPILKILSIFGFIRAISVFMYPLFHSVKKQHIVTLATFIGFLGLAITIVPFVLWWGLEGAAYSALFGTFITLPVLFYNALKLFNTKSSAH